MVTSPVSSLLGAFGPDSFQIRSVWQSYFYPISDWVNTFASRPMETQTGVSHEANQISLSHNDLLSAPTLRGRNTKVCYWLLVHANRHKETSCWLCARALSRMLGKNATTLSPTRSQKKSPRGKNSPSNSKGAHSQLAGIVFRAFQHSRGCTIRWWERRAVS